jgi:hypothetical protein
MPIKYSILTVADFMAALFSARIRRFRKRRNVMHKQSQNADPSVWDSALDAVRAAPKHHKVLFENDNLRVLEVTLPPGDEEPVHHHRWPSIFVLDQIQPPIHDISPEGERLPPNRDVIQALQRWDGQGCLVVHMAPQPAGRVLNESPVTVHGIRIEMKKNSM